MSNRTYPRAGTTIRRQKWVKLGEKNPHKCCVCQAPAIYQSWVEVSWFRGDDEGLFKACKLHKDDATALLATQAQGVAIK